MKGTFPAVRAVILLLLFAPVAPAMVPSAGIGETTAQPTTNWVQWDMSTDRVVSDADDLDAAYPRAKQLSNGEILLAYHHGAFGGAFGATVTLRRSRDGGESWYSTDDVEAPEPGRFWGFSNPDFVELGGGRMLLVSAARGQAASEASDTFLSECRRSGLRLRFSDDYGLTWGKGRTVAAGRGRLWEPSVVRLADGTLEIYYANEAPDLTMDGGIAQRIELIRSTDDGLTWSVPVEVAQDPERRNGMPAALALADGRVACAQEVVGEPTSPWITCTRDGKSEEHYLAQSRYGFGASPFLAHAPDGGTLLAFPTGQGKLPPPVEYPVWWMYQRIMVLHGDARARNFGVASLPWTKYGAHKGAFFPSLLVQNDGTIVVLASFITLRPDGTSHTVVRWLEGRLTPVQPPTPRAPSTDELVAAPTPAGQDAL